MNFANSKILFVYPSRSRPQRFREALQSIKDNLARPELACFVFTVDSDEPHLDKYLKVFHENGVVFYGGKSDSKIHAINRGMKNAPIEWDILVVMSDDMRFTAKGFDDIIRTDMTANYKPGGVTLHYRDPNQPDNHMTLSIMSRDYYGLFGYIYHPSYQSLYCDLEAKDVAQKINRYVYMGGDKIIFTHLHPSLGLSEYDEQYRRTESDAVREVDRLNYVSRRRQDFYLKTTSTGTENFIYETK
jgi:hypothetical protein